MIFYIKVFSYSYFLDDFKIELSMNHTKFVEGAD